MQSVDILKYTDEEYENHLTDSVSVFLKEEFLFHSIMYEVKTCSA